MKPVSTVMIRARIIRYADNRRGCGNVSGFIGLRRLLLVGGLLPFLALVAALLFMGPGHALAQSAPSVDYDTDDNGLIEVSGLA